MQASKPDFFIVGAPKAATSALWAHLRAHPQIFMPELKEPQFFGFDQEHLGHARRTLQEYLGLFGPAGGAERVGEASTNYLHSRTAAAEIAAFQPNASIVVMLRDPVAIMHAYHETQVAWGFEPIHDFAEALEAEQDRRRGRRLPPRSGIRENLYYRQVADLPRHVRRYFDTFGRERVHVVLFDDWCADAAAVYRQVLSFLGVDPGFRPELEPVNENRRVRSRRFHAFVLEPPPAISAAARAVIPAAMRSRWRHLLLRAATRTAPRIGLEPELLWALRQEFAPKIDELAALVDRDLSAWHRLPASATSARSRPAVDPTLSPAPSS